MSAVMTKTQAQVIKDWGNGLGMRINSALAKAAHITSGTPVQIEVVDGGLMVRVLGEPRMTLEEKLAAFDPEIHGGEFVSSGSIGAERF